ncbi:MAG: asparagine synthase-related protein, partial [Allosphingosinicella sp.]
MVLFDGWLANRGALVEAAGLHANARDEELIAHAYRRYGSELPSHVLGEYAAILYDPAAGLLFLTHDALGVRPAFYGAAGDRIWFGSDLAALVAATGTGEIDERYVASLFAGVEDRGDRTPYRHLRRVRQGFGILVERGGSQVRERRGFDPAETVPVRFASSAAYEEAFRAAACEAVETALPSAGTVWCELSGGLDSSMLSILAAGCPGPKIETFSIVFSRSRAADETPWMDALLAACPLRS